MITQAISLDEEEGNLMFYELDKSSGEMYKSIIMFWFRPIGDKVAIDFCGHVSGCGVMVEGKQFKAKVEGIVWKTQPVPGWTVATNNWEPDGFVWTTATNT